MNPPRSLPGIILGVVSASGAAIFLFFLALTFHTPEWVEKFAADFIEEEVSERVDTAIDSLQPPAGASALSRAASAIYARNEEKIEAYRESLRQRVHERLADAIAEVRDLDCDCRDKWAQWLEEDTHTRIRLLQRANQGITEFIQSTYAGVVHNLKHEIRIFTSANALVLLAILALVIWKPRASMQLFVPGILAITATLICSYFYIFEQNWLLAIIFNDYLGYTYFAYLAVVFALLCDIVLNRPGHHRDRKCDSQRHRISGIRIALLISQRHGLRSRDIPVPTSPPGTHSTVTLFARFLG